MYNYPKLTAEMVKKAAYDLGADLVGIGSIDRWKDVPENENPLSIMPRAKSVICFGFRMHRGTLRGVEEGTYFSAYTFNSFADVNNIFAPTLLRRLSSYIEDYGYEAIPIMYYAHNLAKNSGEPTLREDGTPKPRPDIFFNFRTGGVLCGVGEIGHSRVLLTPQFGPAQRIYFIVTEAELEPDPIITGICDHCMECVKHCPAKALCDRCNDNIDIPGITTIRRSSIDDIKCRLAHISGGLSPFAPEDVKQDVMNVVNGTDTECADGSPRPTAADIPSYTARVSYAATAQNKFSMPSALCGDGCIRACLAHLEKEGKLTGKFHHPFRDE